MKSWEDPETEGGEEEEKRKRGGGGTEEEEEERGGKVKRLLRYAFFLFQMQGFYLKPQ